MTLGFAGHLPIAATEIAVKWNELYYFILWVCAFFFALTMGAMVWFIFKYKAGGGRKPVPISHNTALEILWTAVPTALLLFIFGWGYSVYRQMREAPMDAMEVRVVAKQWLWNFQYPDGRVTTDELVLPVGKPVKLIMSSDDVLHSMSIPVFRTKRDIVPGMYSSVWFEPSAIGEHSMYCTEYCGADHSGMVGVIRVVSAADYASWKAGKKTFEDAAGAPLSGAPVSLEDRGRQLTEKMGCIACHSGDGTQKIGPSYKGLYGSTVEFVDGSKAKVDDEYLRESILNSQAKIVKGFGPVMPAYQGQFKEEELNAVLAYIKSLK